MHGEHLFEQPFRPAWHRRLLLSIVADARARSTPNVELLHVRTLKFGHHFDVVEPSDGDHNATSIQSSLSIKSL